jgi:hypothetical protein
LAVRPAVQRVLDGLDMPAFVENSRLEIIAANHLGRALYAVPGSDLALPFNVAKFLFLDNRAREFYRDRDRMAGNQVAILRTETGRDPGPARRLDRPTTSSHRQCANPRPQNSRQQPLTHSGTRQASTTKARS